MKRPELLRDKAALERVLTLMRAFADTAATRDERAAGDEEVAALERAVARVDEDLKRKDRT